MMMVVVLGKVAVQNNALNEDDGDGGSGSDSDSDSGSDSDGDYDGGADRVKRNAPVVVGGSSKPPQYKRKNKTNTSGFKPLGENSASSQDSVVLGSLSPASSEPVREAKKVTKIAANSAPTTNSSSSSNYNPHALGSGPSTVSAKMSEKKRLVVVATAVTASTAAAAEAEEDKEEEVVGSSLSSGGGGGGIFSSSSSSERNSRSAAFTTRASTTSASNTSSSSTPGSSPTAAAARGKMGSSYSSSSASSSSSSVAHSNDRKPTRSSSAFIKASRDASLEGGGSGGNSFRGAGVSAVAAAPSGSAPSAVINVRSTNIYVWTLERTRSFLNSYVEWRKVNQDSPTISWKKISEKMNDPNVDPMILKNKWNELKRDYGEDVTNMFEGIKRDYSET